jgi:hypothetical protein
MLKQIVGNVHWVENGKQTSRLVDVQEAFSDADQAKAQISYTERSGDKRQLRLSRLAYRQYQGKRFRVESGKKPIVATKSRQEISLRKKPSKSKSSKGPARRKVVVKAAKGKARTR